jgi:hypothetical protein
LGFSFVFVVGHVVNGKIIFTKTIQEVISNETRKVVSTKTS